MISATTPKVSLVKSFTNPFRNAIATARTCYSSKGIITDQDVNEKHFHIAHSTYQAGHHTTLQHAHFQFAITDVSRHTIWSFLHSHPFYNSEQVSQRYVEVKPGTFYVPPISGSALELYLATQNKLMDYYHQLNESLLGVTTSAYLDRFPARKSDQKKIDRDVKKKTQEIARYVLPVGTFAYLYHTISGITLLRYWRYCRQYETPQETRDLIEAMVRLMLDHDPEFGEIIQEPLTLEETPEFAQFQQFWQGKNPTKEFINEFDLSLDGRVSKLIGWSEQAESTVASAVREVYGLASSELSDVEAINKLLNPAENKIFGENLNLTTHSKLSRAMVHAHYSFRKKLSHAADSQDQRHRMTPGSRPILSTHITDDPDYITPVIVNLDEKSKRLYDEAMSVAWDAIRKLKLLGVSEEYANFLLPNAVSVRFTESGDLLNLHHKHQMRLCYNAQEEIWRASLDEALQISEVHPNIGRFLLPPCSQRSMSGTRPICPEGDRFCGIKVWRLNREDYSRII
ncbi:MAG: FAD-dependent thymidylate synthase [Bacteroidetes bacterium]|nr:FAD-dependent thymidylate synthase [Bacteroidota bacterium]